MPLGRGGGGVGGAGLLFSSGALRKIKAVKNRQSPTLWGPELLEHTDVIWLDSSFACDQKHEHSPLHLL